jgi:PAS domain S-box-containing protein
MPAPETWGFGITGHLTWLSTAPVIHAALGPAAIFAWLPGVLVGMLVNMQVKRLGAHFPDVAGGTPNYVTRLLKNYPLLGRIAAIGYFFSWIGFIPMNAIVLTALVQANLNPFGIQCPKLMLEIGFTTIAFVMAFTGTRALGMLHLFFVIPAFGFLFVFCLQGLGWLAFSPDSPGFFPTRWPGLTLVEWAKWFFFAVFSTYSCETAAAFVADSQRPSETLRFLKLAGWLIGLVYLGGSWVLMRLATAPDLGTDAYLNLLAAAKPFWGDTASFFVTFLLVSASLLGSATAVASTPRVLYQLALDGHLAPVFATVSRRGVLGPSLVFALVLSFVCLVWGDIARIVVVTGTGWLICFMGLHWGLWLRRGNPEVRWSWLSLGFLLVELFAFVVGGTAWGWQDWLLGMLFPIGILMIDAIVRLTPLPVFQPEWWLRWDRSRPANPIKDFVAFQVIILIILVCSAAVVGWVIRAMIAGNQVGGDLLVILLLTIAFVAIGIACWTSLPQVAAIAEAREHAENLFITALDTVPDTILVLDENGFIQQSNPAATVLFGMSAPEMHGVPLNRFLRGLTGAPTTWASRSEQVFTRYNQRQYEEVVADEQTTNTSNFPERATISNDRIIETTISQRANRKFQEYIVILRDITERKQAEQSLRQSEATLRQQAIQLEQTVQKLKQTQAQLIQTEKMSSLGQLVAGVAHEINNPVNFIYGNLAYISQYTTDLLKLSNLCQQRYAQTDLEIQTLIEDADLDFLAEDVPKVLTSMKVGAERIRQIVLTLRNFSRLDEAEKKPVNIHDGIESTLLILQHRFKAKPGFSGIEVVKHYGQLPNVECYAGQLNQVFMNILSNAIDALNQLVENRVLDRTHDEPHTTPETITIKTEICDRDWVRICISDNGPGITDAIRAKIFDPFFTTKPIGEGTGLGLSISYQIVVDKHGGHLRCFSKPGQGTEFRIEIPVRQKQ